MTPDQPSKQALSTDPASGTPRQRLRDLDLQLSYSADTPQFADLCRAIRAIVTRLDVVLPVSDHGILSLTAALPLLGPYPVRILLHTANAAATVHPAAAELEAAAYAAGSPSVAIGVAIHTPSEQSDGALILVFDSSAPEESAAFSMPLRAGNLIAARWSWGDPQRRLANVKRGFEKRWVCRLQPEPSKPSPPVAPSLPPLLGHQDAAVKAWRHNSGCGIFHMCTGAGKTIAALAAAQSVAGDSRGMVAPSTVVILCPRIILVDQWAREMRAHGIPVSATVYENPDQYVQQLDLSLTSRTTRFVVSTYHSFCHPRFQTLIRRAESQGYRGYTVGPITCRLKTNGDESWR